MYEELVKGLREATGWKNASVHYSLMNEAADAIEELNRENESLANSVNEASEILRKRWIPVTERLPEKDGMYLVHGEWSESGRKATDTCEFYVHDGYFRAAWNFDVTHWMPLPCPPEEDNP